MMSLKRRAVPAGAEALGPDLHPVLRRVYASRGLRTRDELSLVLERLEHQAQFIARAQAA